jgi:hypothetical protein
MADQVRLRQDENAGDALRLEGMANVADDGEPGFVADPLE